MLGEEDEGSFTDPFDPDPLPVPIPLFFELEVLGAEDEGSYTDPFVDPDPFTDPPGVLFDPLTDPPSVEEPGTLDELPGAQVPLFDGLEIEGEFPLLLEEFEDPLFPEASVLLEGSFCAFTMVVDNAAIMTILTIIFFIFSSIYL